VTSTHQKTLNPIFNETFTFSVPYERIRHTSLVISVMDHDRPVDHVTGSDVIVEPDLGCSRSCGAATTWTTTANDVAERARRHHVTGSDVMDHDRLGRNDKIGQLVLGTKSGAMEVKHWNEMFAKSRQAVPKWHILKDFD